MEAGLDSLGAVELRNALGTRFGITELHATVTLDYPTMAALSRYLLTLAASAAPTQVALIGAEEVASIASSVSHAADLQVIPCSHSPLANA